MEIISIVFLHNIIIDYVYKINDFKGNTMKAQNIEKSQYINFQKILEILYF